MYQIRVADVVVQPYWYRVLAGRMVMAAEKIEAPGGQCTYYKVNGFDHGTIIYAEDCVEVPMNVETLSFSSHHIGS